MEAPLFVLILFNISFDDDDDDDDDDNDIYDNEVNVFPTAIQASTHTSFKTVLSSPYLTLPQLHPPRSTPQALRLRISTHHLNAPHPKIPKRYPIPEHLNSSH